VRQKLSFYTINPAESKSSFKKNYLILYIFVGDSILYQYVFKVQEILDHINYSNQVAGTKKDITSNEILLNNVSTC